MSLFDFFEFSEEELSTLWNIFLAVVIGAAILAVIIKVAIDIKS